MDRAEDAIDCKVVSLNAPMGLDRLSRPESTFWLPAVPGLSRYVPNMEVARMLRAPSCENDRSTRSMHVNTYEEPS